MSIIRKNKTHEDMPDFDEMMSEVNEDIQEKDAEQDIISRVPELRKLRENIDQATANWRVPLVNWRGLSSSMTVPKENWILLSQTSGARLTTSIRILTM